MSKRKKTPTSKNTVTKVKLVKKINELDMKHLLTYGNQTGIIGCAYKITYARIEENEVVKVRELCAKSMETIEKTLSTATQFGFNTEEEIDILQNSINSLVHDFVNGQLASQFDGMDDARVTSIIFTMLSTYIFLKEDLKNYCAANKDNRVGILVEYHCEYNEVEDSMTAKLKVIPVGDIENWMDVSTEFLAAENATILKEA